MTGGVRMVEDTSSVPMSRSEPTQNPQRAPCEYSELLNQIEEVENAMQIESEDSTGEEHSGEYQLPEPEITDDSDPSIGLSEDIELDLNCQSPKEQSEEFALTQSNEETPSEYFTAESQQGGESSQESHSTPSDEGNQSDAYYTADSHLTTESGQELLTVQSDEGKLDTHSDQSDEGSLPEVLSQIESRPSTELSQETYSVHSEEGNESDTETPTPVECGSEIQTVQFDDDYEVELNSHVDTELQSAPVECLSVQKENKTAEDTQAESELVSQIELSQENKDGSFEMNITVEIEHSSEFGPEAELIENTQEDNCSIETPFESQPHTESRPEADLSEETQDDNCDNDATDLTQSQTVSGFQKDESPLTEHDNWEIDASDKTEPQIESDLRGDTPQDDNSAIGDISFETHVHIESTPQLELSHDNQEDTTEMTELLADYEPQIEPSQTSHEDKDEVDIQHEKQFQIESRPQSKLSNKTQDDDCGLDTIDETQCQAESAPQTEVSRKTQDDNCEKEEPQPQTISEFQTELSHETENNSEIKTSEETLHQTESESQLELYQETQTEVDILKETVIDPLSEIELSQDDTTEMTELLAEYGPQIDPSQTTSHEDKDEVDIQHEIQSQIESRPQSKLSNKTQDDDCGLDTIDELQCQAESAPQTELSRKTQDDKCEKEEPQPQTISEFQTELSHETEDNSEIKTSEETLHQTESESQIELHQETQTEVDILKETVIDPLSEIELSQDDTTEMTELLADYEPQIEPSQTSHEDKDEVDIQHEIQSQIESRPQSKLSNKTQDDDCGLDTIDETQCQAESAPQTELSRKTQDDNCEKEEPQPQTISEFQTELSHETEDNSEIKTSEETLHQTESESQIKLCQETQPEVDIVKETIMDPLSETELSQETQQLDKGNNSYDNETKATREISNMLLEESRQLPTEVQGSPLIKSDDSSNSVSQESCIEHSNNESLSNTENQPTSDTNQESQAPTESGQDNTQLEQADIVDNLSAIEENQPVRPVEGNENHQSSNEEACSKDISLTSNTDTEESREATSATDTEKVAQVESQNEKTGETVETVQESSEGLIPTETSQDSQPNQSDVVNSQNATVVQQPATSSESNENPQSSNEEASTDKSTKSTTDAEERQETDTADNDQDNQAAGDGETAETVESDDNQYEEDSSSESSDEWESKGDGAVDAGNSDSGAEVEDDTSQESETKTNSSELFITIKDYPPNVENGHSENPHGFEILEIFQENEKTDPKYESQPALPKKDPNVEEPFILRRSSRSIKRKRYYEDIDNGRDDSDIDNGNSDLDDNQVIEYKRKAKTLIVTDTKALIEMTAKQVNSNKGNGRKEPTVVIIDQNFLPGQTSAVRPQPCRYPVRVSNSAQSAFQNIEARCTTIRALRPKVNASTQSPNRPIILPTLKDDMFVLETPSFIVPYVYERPSIKPLREFVDVLGRELAEQEAKEDSMKQKEHEESEEKSLDKKNEEKNSEEVDSNSRNNEQVEIIKDRKDMEVTEAQDLTKESEKQENRKCQNGGDDNSWDGGSTSDSENEVGSDGEAKTVVIKEKINTVDVKDVTDLTVEKVITGKTDNYFHSSLGQFFMNIGLNLVQEYVQTDLLKLNNRKLNKEKKLGEDTKLTEHSIMALKKNLATSKQNNAPYHFPLSSCQKCGFKTESLITLSHHNEAPHFKDGFYQCNMCSLQTRNAHDILYHTEAEHNVRSRLERPASYHQCPNCPFEDSGKSKLSRHSFACTKKFKLNLNCAPAADWEPPAKIPKQMSQFHNQHHIIGSPHTFNRAQGLTNPLNAQRGSMYRNGQEGHYRNLIGRNVSNGLGTASDRSQEGIRVFSGQGARNALPQGYSNTFFNGPGSGAFKRIHGDTNIRPVAPGYRPRMSKPLIVDRGVKGTTHYATMKTAAVVRGITIRHCNSSTVINIPVNECSANLKPKKINMPEVTITPLPPQPRPQFSVLSANNCGVVCEICDERLNDRQHLLYHMQWIHKVKIAPRMINFKPPLACKKCPLRFRTDQGLERHLLGAHGLVTNSVQEAANKGLDGGKCPLCGKVFQRMLLDHVEREHHMKLRPAWLSYKCNVCTATFTMYKYFENHIFSVHSDITKPNANRSAERKDLDVVEVNDTGSTIPRPRRVPVITSTKAVSSASATAANKTRDK